MLLRLLVNLIPGSLVVITLASAFVPFAGLLAAAAVYEAIEVIWLPPLAGAT
jgi:hypothetical protein